MTVRKTGTRTSFHERSPRGRQPRIRWASLTAVNVRPKPDTRFSDVATAMPVRSSGPGTASTTSCGSRTTESGATASRLLCSLMLSIFFGISGLFHLGRSLDESSTD